jgi:hypothetical protein
MTRYPHKNSQLSLHYTYNMDSGQLPWIVMAYRNSTAFKDLLPLRDKLAKFRSFVVEGVPL